MTSGNGRAGNGWDGHLPSDKTERAILNAMDGIEDEDGNKSSFLNTEEPEVCAVGISPRGGVCAPR